MARVKKLISLTFVPHQPADSPALTLEEVVELYTEIAQLIYSCTPKLETVKIDQESASEKIRAGRPLLERERLRLDFLATIKLFFALCHLLKRKGRKCFHQVKEIEQTVARPRRKLRELLARVAKGGKVGWHGEPKGGLLEFLLLTSLRPTFRAYGKMLMPMVDQSLWMRSYCPICGSEPNLAELKGDEKIRFLYCSLCGAGWQYQRLKCPFCHNEDYEKLGLFALEEKEERHRVYVCLQCKRYLKTMVAPPQQLSELPWYQDVTTIHLDLIALGKGYVKTPMGITG